MGMFGCSAYASSKFAPVGLLYSLRAELAPVRHWCDSFMPAGGRYTGIRA